MIKNENWKRIVSVLMVMLTMFLMIVQPLMVYAKEVEKIEVEEVKTEVSTNESINEEVKLFEEMEPGETITIHTNDLENSSPIMSYTLSGSTVSITKNSEAYYYSDYGLGSFHTYKYTVMLGPSKAEAYCVQPTKYGPDSGTYSFTKLSDGKKVAKVCFYGTKAASGENSFFATSDELSALSSPARHIVIHMAVSYANGSSDAFAGASEKGKKLAMQLYDYCMEQPEIPEVDMSFTEDKLIGYIDGNVQRTQEVTFKADELQNITLNLPEGVKFHNVTSNTTSKAGESVTISGNTKFYLFAPLDQAKDVSPTWSATMKGAITKDYSAYKISTGSGYQDLAFVFGEGVDDEKYIDLSVSWVQEAGVKIIKKDAQTKETLTGSVYGIYSDAACTKLITKLPETNSKGEASISFTKTQDTVYLKEITAPSGYVLSSASYGVKLVIGDTVTQVVTNEEQLGNLTIYKMGEVLTSAKVTEDGVTFNYTEKKLKGAVYSVYATEEITTPTGTVVYKKGALVAENLTTNSEGSVTLKNLHLGKYTIKESKAPTNYVNQSTSKNVTLSYAGQTVETVFKETTFTNDRQKAKLSVMKKDKDTNNPLLGGVFGLYSGSEIKNTDGEVIVKKDTFIQQVTSNTNGQANFSADIPIGYSYYVKELKAPNGYLRNTTDTYSFKFSYTTDEEASVSFSYTFKNTQIKATIKLYKKDSETKTAQGDATLEGAVYGLYARENIVHPDGKTGILYQAGTEIKQLTTDKTGYAEVKNLNLGKYYIKEITPSVGYVLDPKEYDLICTSEGDLVATVEKECISLEEVKKQPFQVIKIANNGATDAPLLKGVGFSAYLISSLTVKDDGSYDFTKANPVVITSDGRTEMFTDEIGYTCSIPLPYGTYLVRETTSLHNYLPVKDFTVTISENSPNKPQVWRVLLDDEFKAKLKIIKQDDETKKTVLSADTEFKVYDMDNKKYVEQVTTYPTTTLHTSYFTDSDGYLILPQNLPIGHYRIEEVTAPEGYTLNENYVEIIVDSDTAYQENLDSNDIVIEVIYENHPVKGKLIIEKEGEILSGFDGKFQYTNSFLANAQFEVYAKETIYTPDYQKDDEGNRVVIYQKDELVTTVETDENGQVVVEDLALGSYYIVEKNAPEGYVLNTTPMEVTFSYQNQNTPIVEETVKFNNDRQKVELTVIKEDKENEATISGATFAFYPKEDIKKNEEVLVKADTLLEEVVTGTEGKATFTLDIPFGKYYVKETKAPNGYVSTDEVVDFEVSYQGQNIPVVKLAATIKNYPTTIEVTKSDLTTSIELEGATLTVLDEDGKIVDTWTSSKEEAHVIKCLIVGKTYTLREELAPYGYLKATDISFTVEDTQEIQKVEMKDEVPTGLLIINKQGGFLESINLVEQIDDWIEHVFSYVTGNLTEVSFEVYALEEIKAADGVSDSYYQKDQLVTTVKTDEWGIAKVENLPLGKYYVKEVNTKEGYVLDKEIREVDLTYRNQDTPVVTYNEDWQNQRQKVAVNVLKKEKDSERVLSGAVFALCNKEDIISTTGEILLEANSVIEQKATNKDGLLTFNTDLPIDASYYVKEIQAPVGFVISKEWKEFTFTYQGDKVEQAEYSFTFENEATKVEISKTDITGENELPDAKLTILDENEQVIERWTSTNQVHYIERLPVGSYILREESAPKGYIISEDVEFTVENTGEIQKVKMKDATAKGKLIIDKVDADDDKPLKGVEYELRDAKGKVLETLKTDTAGHAESKLYEIATNKDGVYKQMITYYLVETKALDGYQLDSTKHKIQFNYVDDKTPIVEVKKTFTNKKNSDKETTTETQKEQYPSSPYTGDSNRLFGLIGLMLVAILVSSVVWIRRKKI